MTMTAVGSAHLTGVTDASRPTVFEILSQQGFAHALKPAAFHVIRILAEQRPSGWFGSAFRYFDELYLAFDSVVQWHYLLTRGATLSESFYGFERKFGAYSGDKLNRIRLSYLASILLPFATSKLETFYKLQIENEDTHGTSQEEGNYRKVQESFVKFYPYFKMLIRAINLFYLLAYTFNRTEHHSLTFKMLRMTLGYASEERSKFIEEKNAELWMSSMWKNPKNVPKLLLRSLGESVLFAVEMGTFFIQFLEWWYNDDKRSRITVASLPIPPPPQTLVDSSKAEHLVKLLPSDIDKCPLCRKEFKNPTVVSVSGVVYCYGCIFPRINEQRMCPLTSLPCNLNHLIRIFQ